jgi:hypothetical protein
MLRDTSFMADSAAAVAPAYANAVELVRQAGSQVERRATSLEA